MSATNLKTNQPKRPLVKCGGFSSQLAVRLGECIDGDPLWGSRCDGKYKNAILQTHADFLQNGAQIILCNTYQSSIEGFMQYLDLNREQSIQYMRKSVQLAKEARAKYIATLAKGNRDPSLPMVMASIGPYGAHLHNGSEYDGSYADSVSVEEMKEWHRPRIEACLSEGVDGLAVETIPCQLEAEALVDMILQDYPGVKFWVSFQCKDDERLAHNELFADAVASVWGRIKLNDDCKRCLAIGVNCVNPKFVASLLRSARNVDRIPMIVYSNRGESFNRDTAEWSGLESCLPLETFVPEWIKLGAEIIGGCCRVYPDTILRIRNCIDDLYNSNREN